MQSIAVLRCALLGAGGWQLTTALLLYYITDRAQFPGDEAGRTKQLLDKITEAARSGVDYIQLREKDLSSRELEQLARAAIERVRASGSMSRLLINSRTDIALAVGADGVHLQSRDILGADLRKIWREANSDTQPIVAVSCHTEAEVAGAKASGADFVVFGPVFEKLEASPTGLATLRAACQHEIPVLALGGITLENARSCIRTGVAGVAAIRLFQQAEIQKIVAKLRA